MKSSIRIFVALVLLLAFFSCNESSSLSSKDKKNPPDDAKEDEPADSPVEVSGSYLTCDWVGDPTEGKDTVAGCSVATADGQPLARSDRKFDLTLHDSDDSPIEMVTTDAPEDSNWYKLAKIPASHLAEGYLKISVARSDKLELTAKINTADIGKSIALGNHSNTEYTGEGSSLTTITTHGQWVDKFKANMGLKMSDFCESDGSVRSQLSVESDIMVTLADQLLQTNTTNKNIVIKDTKISASSSACFVRFRELGGSKKIAHANRQQTCFYLHTGVNLHIISVQKAQAENPDFNFENLEKFASSKACP